MPVMQQPEAYISGSNKLVNDKGEFEDPAKRDYFQKIMGAFANWIGKNAGN
jgi:chromate reductase